MTFRKYAVSYWSMRILNLVCMGGAGWVLAGLYPFSNESMPLCFLTGGICAMMILLFFVAPWNEKLRIDERGIYCLRRNRAVWVLAWDEIDQICTVPVHRCRGYAIVLKNTPAQDLSRPVSAPDYTFEHTRSIRTALEKYCRNPIVSSK